MHRERKFMVPCGAKDTRAQTKLMPKLLRLYVRMQGAPGPSDRDVGSYVNISIVDTIDMRRLRQL